MVKYFQVLVWLVDTAAVVWVAAVGATLQTATVMQTVTCLRIAAVMFQVTVRSKVYLLLLHCNSNKNISLVTAGYVHIIIIIVYTGHFNVIFLIEFTEYIMITNKNYIHRIDINETRSRYRLQTPVSGLKNATSLDYHYKWGSDLYLWWASSINLNRIPK